MGVAVFLLMLAGGGIFWWMRLPSDTPEAIETISPSEAVLETSSVSPVSLEPAVSQVALSNEATYKSEHFRAGVMLIEGEVGTYVSQDTLVPLQITNIRGEAFPEKNKQEVRLVITWQTNKLSLAAVQYAKGTLQSPKTVSEEGFGLSHSVTLFGLDQASTYVYALKSQDQFGNELTSEQHAVYTGSKTVSLFDLIADAIGEVFGWAMTKK